MQLATEVEAAASEADLTAVEAQVALLTSKADATETALGQIRTDIQQVLNSVTIARSTLTTVGSDVSTMASSQLVSSDLDKLATRHDVLLTQSQLSLLTHGNHQTELGRSINTIESRTGAARPQLNQISQILTAVNTLASSQLGPSDLTNSFSASLSEPSNPNSVYGALRSILTSLAGLSGGGGAVANEFVPVKFRFTPAGERRKLWTTMKVIGSNGVTHDLDPNDFVRSLNPGV